MNSLIKLVPMFKWQLLCHEDVVELGLDTYFAWKGFTFEWLGLGWLLWAKPVPKSRAG